MMERRKRIIAAQLTLRPGNDARDPALVVALTMDMVLVVTLVLQLMS